MTGRPHFSTMTEVDDNASGRGLGGNLSPPTCSSIGQSSHNNTDITEMAGRSGPCPRRTRTSVTASKSGTSESESLVPDRMTSMGGNSESSDEHQNNPTALPQMQPFDRRLKLPTIPEYGDQLTGNTSGGRKRQRNNNASHRGIRSGSGRSRQRKRTLATSTLAFCAALIGVINLGSGVGHYHGGRNGFLRGSYSPDSVGSGANPLSRRDVRRILAAIEDSGGDASSAEDVGDRAHRSLSSTPSENAADGQHRTLAGIDDERLLQAFSPDEYRLLQAATQTAEYKKNPVGVMTMLLQHLKQVKGVAAKVTGSNGEGAGETTEGENTSEGAGSDENEDNGDDEDKDKSQYSDRMAEVIDHLYRKATEFELLKKNGVPNPPPVPAYLELFEHYGWKFNGLASTLLKARDPDLLKKTRELRYPEKFTCTDIDEETGKPIKKIRKPGEADECYMKLMPLVEILDDDPDEKERRSIMDRFNMVHTAVKERMDDDRREEMKRRAEEMRESEKRRQEREDKEKMEKEAREREEARKAQGW